MKTLELRLLVLILLLDVGVSKGLKVNVPNTDMGRIGASIKNWLNILDSVPGWREWKRSHIAHVLFYDDPLPSFEVFEKEFDLDPKLEEQRNVIVLYLELVATLDDLKQVEWYFRRYPFSGTPVSHAQHLKFCCELYFGKFYQFKERLKKLSEAVKKLSPDHPHEFGTLIREFEKRFKQEISERNRINHHKSFDDVTLDRIFVLGLRSKANSKHKNLLKGVYKSTSADWAKRAKKRSADLEVFVEVVAKMLLEGCAFLEPNTRS